MDILTVNRGADRLGFNPVLRMIDRMNHYLGNLSCPADLMGNQMAVTARDDFISPLRLAHYR